MARELRERVPGYTIRDRDGDLIGYQCPICRDAFHGPDAEREQYERTLAIMQEQGDDIPIAERRKRWRIEYE